MNAIAASPWAVWGIAGVATAGVIIRPFAWPEYVWAVVGAFLLVVFGLVAPADALAGVARGMDVYLFLTGMMLLSELARQEGLFDWLAAWAGRCANGSAAHLFALLFAVGTVVTAFLSNDATAVVLTPAVAAVARAAEAKDPLPYLFICALVANAASFVLPISNPANLVFYGNHMPSLLDWLSRYAIPSFAAIVVTFGTLRLAMCRRLRQTISVDIDTPELSTCGRLAAFGIAATTAALLAASAFDIQLGFPTFCCGVATTLLVFSLSECRPLDTIRGISWGVLVLVAGLFVLVEGLERTGITAQLAALLHDIVLRSADVAGWVAGIVVGFGCNLVNNLPAGLFASRVVATADVPDKVRAAVLIAVDLGPNLSVTGSLATILWLIALRRDGHQVGALAFLKVGVVVMSPALLLAIFATLAMG
jgi:arsenical pump membrane protein